jgi:4-hydroxybenzoate polyprenyltransferase
MKEILWLEKNKLKKSILIGFSIPLFLYIFFVFSCVGALGSDISEIVTISLAKYGAFFLLFGNIFAFFAMSTCFISLGNALREIYWQDFGINKNLSFILAVTPPLISLLGLATFIQILSITGSLFMIPLMIIILYLYYKTRKIGERKPEYELRIPDFAIWLIALFLIFTMFLVTVQSLI